MTCRSVSKKWSWKWSAILWEAQVKTPGKNTAKMVTDARLKALKIGHTATDSVPGRGSGAILFHRQHSGVVTVTYRYMHEGRRRKHQMGIYKSGGRDAGASLQQLRVKAQKLAQIAREHGDVTIYMAGLAAEKARRQREREHQAEIAARRGTLWEMLEAYVDRLDLDGKASSGKVRSLFRVNVLEQRPELAAKYADEITPEDIKSILDGVLSRRAKGRGIGNKAKAPETSMRSTCDELRRYLRRAFTVAAAMHLTPGKSTRSEQKNFLININPAALIPALSDAGGGATESLTPQELSALLSHIDSLPERHRAICKALIYFGGQRLKQILAVTWDGAGEDTLSLVDAKGQKRWVWEHLVPITPRVKEILAPLWDKPIGPGPFSLTPGKLIHKSTASKAFTDVGRTLSASGKTRKFTWLNIRATVETLLAAHGVNEEVRAWLLSHGRKGVQKKHYDRFAYLPEKREALELWGSYLDELSNKNTVPSKVVLLKKKFTLPSRCA